MKTKKNQYQSLKTVLALALSFFLFPGCSSYKPLIIDIPYSESEKVEQKKDLGNVDVALVLGAGGSRAFAHLGILEVLEEEGVPIDLLVGSSAGSLIGALYADNPNARAIRNRIINLKKADLMDTSISALLLSPVKVTGPVQGNALQKFLVKELRAKNFEDLKITLVAVATNVENNHIVMLKSGPIAPAIHASAALPPVFSPVNLYNQTLADGGIIAPVPVQVARLYNPKLLIAIDISMPPSKLPLSNAFDLIYRSMDIGFYELSRLQASKADISIHPNLVGYGTFEDSYNLQLYEKGKATARASMQEIKDALSARGIPLKIKKKPPIPVNS